MKVKQEEIRPIDLLFAEYAAYHQHPTNRLLHWIFVPLLLFSIIGLVTAIPFPHLAFLGKYNMFINWFSFLLAGSIYYYLRLSPLLSYLMLFTIGILFFFIVQLEYVEQDGGPALWQVSLCIFVISWIGKFIGYKIEGKMPPFLSSLRFLLIGPIWFIHIILKKFNLRY